MDDKKFSTNLFANGSIWLRADFHLHTLADKEFKYSGEKNNFITDYVARLKATGIRLGVITNHNKFDEVEFRELRRKAHKEGIYLLPGVELSVNDGASGIHLLIIFSESWLENGDYISPAITSMFPGKAELEFQNENGRSERASCRERV